LSEEKGIIQITEKTKKLNDIAQKLYENHKELNIVAERNFFEKKFLHCAICYEGEENKYLSGLLEIYYPHSMIKYAILDIFQQRMVQFFKFNF
jgi:hypothetical protein